MIFLTVGTQLPFDRLVRALDAWAAEHPDAEVFGQIAEPGPDGAAPINFPWKPFLSPEEVAEKTAAAEVIVAHAGMGSIIGALTAGKPLVIMPRRGHLQEHRNDHQHATAKMFGEKPGIEVAAEAADLGPALARARAQAGGAGGAGISATAEPRLIAAVRAAIFSA